MGQPMSHKVGEASAVKQRKGWDFRKRGGNWKDGVGLGREGWGGVLGEKSGALNKGEGLGEWGGTRD